MQPYKHLTRSPPDRPESCKQLTFSRSPKPCPTSLPAIYKHLQSPQSPPNPGPKTPPAPAKPDRPATARGACKIPNPTTSENCPASTPNPPSHCSAAPASHRHRKPPKSTDHPPVSRSSITPIAISPDRADSANSEKSTIATDRHSPVTACKPCATASDSGCHSKPNTRILPPP